MSIVRLPVKGRFTIPTSKVYKLCEFCTDCVWRIIAEGSKVCMKSALRAAKRDCKGRKFCVALSMCKGVGDCINL